MKFPPTGPSHGSGEAEGDTDGLLKPDSSRALRTFLCLSIEKGGFEELRNGTCLYLGLSRVAMLAL